MNRGDCADFRHLLEVTMFMCFKKKNENKSEQWPFKFSDTKQDETGRVSEKLSDRAMSIGKDLHKLWPPLLLESS